MAEYIKRSDAMKVCQDYSSHCFTTNDASGQDIADRIENDIVVIPTADVVEVVRCKECNKTIGQSLTGEKLCCVHEIAVPDNYYCASGETRDT